MIIRVYENRKIRKEYVGKEGTQYENNVSEIQFIIPEIYSNFTKKIVFITKTENFSENINAENKYIIKDNVSQYRKIYCYVWLTKEKEDFRSELFEMNFNCNLEESEEISNIDEYNS